jgi:hypothetical protein
MFYGLACGVRPPPVLFIRFSSSVRVQILDPQGCKVWMLGDADFGSCLGLALRHAPKKKSPHNRAGFLPRQQKIRYFLVVSAGAVAGVAAASVLLGAWVAACL